MLLRIVIVFAATIAGFAILSALVGWPSEKAWGMAVLIALALAALPLLGPLLTFLRDSNAVIDLKGIKLDLSAANAPQVRFETSLIKGSRGQFVNDSDAAKIAETAKAASSSDFLIVDLGAGREWWRSRLFVLAAACVEFNGPRAILLTSLREGVSGHYVGWIESINIVRAYYQMSKQYEKALLTAQLAMAHLRESAVAPAPDNIPPNPIPEVAAAVQTAYVAEGELAFVPALIKALQGLEKKKDKSQPAQWEAREDPNNPVWLTATEIESLLDPWLVTSSIRSDALDQDKMKTLSEETHDYVATIDKAGHYLHLIDINAAARRITLSAMAGRK